MLEEVEFVRRVLTTANGISATSGVVGQLATPSAAVLAADSFLVVGPFSDQDTLVFSSSGGVWTGGGGFYIDVQTPSGLWLTAQCYDAVTGAALPIATPVYVTGLASMGRAVRADIGGFENARIRASGTFTEFPPNPAGLKLYFNALAYKLQSPIGFAAAISAAIPNPLPVSVTGLPLPVTGPLTDVQLAARLPLSVRDVPLTTTGAITAGSAVNGVLSVLTSTALAPNSSLSLALNGEETLTVAMTQGTWTGGGTFYVDVSPDGGTNWVTKTLYTQGGSVGGVLSTLTFASTVLQSARVDVAGMTHARVRASGTVTPSVDPTFTMLAFRGNPLEGVATQAPCSTPAQSTVASNLANVTLLAAKPSRLGATIFNDSTTGNLYVRLGTTASTANFTVRIVPQGYYELPYRYTGNVDGLWDIASGNARITEFTA